MKEQNGAAMSLGRTSTFLDVYFQRDLAEGTINEEQAQEIIDDFVIKLRIVRFLRTPEYDELFAGDPTWVTESIAGMGDDGRPLVTKTSFRMLHTLYTLGPAPEPNLTIWYSPRLPEPFRRFSAKVAIDTSSIQFESDEMMRQAWGDDGAIACCVSPMRVGKQMQFFGARANLAKCLLFAINGGRDEISGEQIGPALDPVTGDVLDFDDVLGKYERMMDWLAGVYVNAMNIIHYMHDKYAYERLEMALHDYAPLRTMAFGMAGMSVVADSLSAIKHAKVHVVRDENGLITDYRTEGEFPVFGNNDNRVDHLASWVVSTFMKKLRKYPTYRDAVHTQSILTITSNVVYGKATGNTPDGRRLGEPFAPGANPMHGRDSHGLHAAAASVAKIPYRDAADGISLTASLVPSGLGRTGEDRITNLTSLLDAFFGVTGYHMNVNVLNRETLMDAMDHPERYPHLTIRVSGYAVNFVRLTREQQMDVINRTFHGEEARSVAAAIPSAGGSNGRRSRYGAGITRGQEPVRAARQSRGGRPRVGRQDGACHRRDGVPALLYHRVGGRWPRHPRRRVDGGVHVALPVLPQSRHVVHAQRHTRDHREGRRGTAQISLRPARHVRWLHPERRRALDAGSLRREAAHGGEADGRPHGPRHERLLRRSPDRRGARGDRRGAARSQGLGPRAPRAADGDGQRADAGVRAAPRRAESGPSGCGSFLRPAGPTTRPRSKAWRASRHPSGTSSA